MSLLNKLKFWGNDEKFIKVVNANLVGFDDQITDEELISKGYSSNSDAYSIIKKISTVGSNIPLVLNKYSSDGEKEEVTSGEAYDLLKEPIKGVSTKEFIDMSMTYLLSSGDLYYRPDAPIGFLPTEIPIYPSGLMSVKGGKSYFDGVDKYVFHDKSNDLKIGPEEIIHIKYMNPSAMGVESLKGLSPLRAAYLSLEASNDILKGSASTVKNQGVRGILTNRSDRAMTPDQKKDMAKIANSKLSGAHNLNKIFSSNANVDFVQLGMSNADLKILELGVLSLRQLCNAYGVASVLFNDPANSKFANVKEAEKALVLNAVIPNLDNKILWTLNTTVLKQFSIRDNTTYRWEIDKEKIEVLQTDRKEEVKTNNSKAETLLKLLESTIPNESKIQILMHSHGINEMDAIALVGNIERNEFTTEG